MPDFRLEEIIIAVYILMFFSQARATSVIANLQTKGKARTNIICKSSGHLVLKEGGKIIDRKSVVRSVNREQKA